MRENIPYSTFTYWRRKLDRERRGNSLVKVNNLVALPEAGATVVKVRVGRILIELTGGESEELLGKVFRALKALS